MKTQTCTPTETPFSPKEELRLVQQELETARCHFNMAEDSDLIDCCIHQLTALENARIICCGCSGILGFDFHSRQCYNRNQRRRLRKDIFFLPFEMTGRYNL